MDQDTPPAPTPDQGAPEGQPSGRPTKYNAKIGKVVCLAIMSGRTLREIDEDPELPAKSTILEWVARGHSGEGKYKEFADQYARARDIGWDVQAEETVDIADDRSLDPKQARNMIQARQWLAGKRLPKKYGERVEIVPPEPVDVPADLNDPDAMREWMERVMGADAIHPRKRTNLWGRS